ncbi:MAG: hypothetical protein O7A69_10770 [SAR324 cluster bacterium]|nr:hypothetical protein [SAR324 cluster bacterium]
MNNIKSRYLISALAPFLVLMLISGCTASRVDWDKAAMREVKKVALVLYTVPLTIEYYDDPRERKKTLLQTAAAIATAQNGSQAATKAQMGFIDQINKEKLRFRFISRDQMMGNSAFRNVLNKHNSMIADRKAKMEAEEKKSETTASKALSMLASFSLATGGNPYNEGAGPEGAPEFGLAGLWKSTDSALTGNDGEMEFVKEAIAALGVDAVMIVNDPGFSFGCEACVGGTGSGTTASAFLVTLLDKDAEVILEMRQWWNVGGGSSAMVAYIINPLQHDSLFEKHGGKTARVFANYYREEGGK